MVAAPSFEPEQDQRVILRGMSWAAFEAMLALRGDTSGVRMYYLDGEIELVSPTKIHEARKKTLARLLETWALETDVPLNGFGSWTLKRELKDAGAEPDECYIVGTPGAKDVPDLVLEVEWSKVTGLPKHGGARQASSAVIHLGTMFKVDVFVRGGDAWSRGTRWIARPVDLLARARAAARARG